MTCKYSFLQFPMLNADEATCHQCKFEFCWESLASWMEIYNAGTKEYNHSAHKEGCFFRASEYQSNGIHGESVETALHIP